MEDFNFALFFMSLMVIFLGKKAYPTIFKFNLRAFLILAVLASTNAVTRIVTGYFNYGFLMPLDITSMLNTLSLVDVMWEDLLFVLPSLILAHHKRSKFIRYPVLIFSALLFGLGHLYFDSTWAVTTVFLMLISYSVALRYGILTTIAIHILFDVIQTLSSYLTIG